MRVSSLMTMSGGGIIVALNGALQKRFVLPGESQLVPGNVHRIHDVQVGIGGKGQDVAIALSCIGYAREKLKIAQFLGIGPEGDQVHAMLEERVGKEAMQMTVRSKSRLRTCTSVVAKDTTTELIEPSGVITADEISELISKVNELEGRSAAAICVMGSMPPGCSDSTYADIYQSSANSDTLCVIDSVAGLKPLIDEISKKGKGGPTIFKVNASELCALARLEKSNNELDGIKQEELVAAIAGFFQEFGLNAVHAFAALAITDGKHPAHLALVDQEAKSLQIFQISMDALPDGRTLFPIGAGDAVAAGTLAAWQCLLETKEKGEGCLPFDIKEALSFYNANIDVAKEESVAAMLTAFTFGLACGSASCLQEENSVLDRGDVLKLFKNGKPAFLSTHQMSPIANMS